MRWKETEITFYFLTSLEIDQFKITWNLRRRAKQKEEWKGNRKMEREQSKEWLFVEGVKYEKISK